MDPSPVHPSARPSRLARRPESRRSLCRSPEANATSKSPVKLLLVVGLSSAQSCRIRAYLEIWSSDPTGLGPRRVLRWSIRAMGGHSSLNGQDPQRERTGLGDPQGAPGLSRSTQKGQQGAQTGLWPEKRLPHSQVKLSWNTRLSSPRDMVIERMPLGAPGTPQPGMMHPVSMLMGLRRARRSQDGLGRAKWPSRSSCRALTPDVWVCAERGALVGPPMLLGSIAVGGRLATNNHRDTPWQLILLVPPLATPIASVRPGAAASGPTGPFRSTQTCRATRRSRSVNSTSSHYSWGIG